MTDASMKSRLHITNDLVTSSLSVTPVLWLSNGVKYVLPAVNLPPSGTAIVDINQALADQGLAPYGTLSGYVEIDYQWPWDALCATVVNVDVAHSVIFNYSLQMSTPAHPTPQAAAHASSQTLEGLWWKQEANVTGFVALTNPGSQAISASLVTSDSLGNPLGQNGVTVSPHGTKMVSLALLPQTAGSAGGLRIVYNGSPNDLFVSGGLRDDATGYSANISFAPPPSGPQQASTVSAAAVGLMTGAAEPMLSFPAGTVFTPYAVVRNISSQPLSFTPNFWWMAGGVAKNAALSQVSLAPYQTLNMDVTSLLALAGLKNYNGSVNLVLNISANSLRGAMLFSTGSVDKKNTYVFQVNPGNVKESIAKNLSYWSTANGDDTMVTLWNPADEAQDFLFTLFYAGGHYKYPLHLEPRATSMFNVSEILHSAIPDAEGNVIPAGVQEGSAELAGSQGEAQHILVSMDTGTYNLQKAICSTHCVTCQGAVNSWVTDSPFALAMGAKHQLTFTVQNHSGAQYNDTGVASWSSTNTSVATVSSGLVNGVAPGSLNADVVDDGYPLYATQCFPQGVTTDCPISTGTSGGSPGTAYDTTPIITGIDPSDWSAGATTQVTFSGQYFGTNAPALSFSPSSGISYTLSSYNDTQIVASVTVPAGTPNEDVSVSVTNNGYGGSSFNGGSVGQSPTSVPIYATVHAPIINSPRITVIAWVDGTAPDLNPLPSGANQNMVTNLNSGPTTCGGELFSWSVLQVPVDIHTSTDQAYANGWLIKYSANTAPPATITPSAQLAAGNFRLFNDFGGAAGGGVQIGITPDPCGVVPVSILNWIALGEASQYMGASGTSPSGKFYQLSEGRVGKMGQAGYYTINNRAAGSMPWIWSAIEFDSSGNPTYSDTGMFPTYSVYVNGVLQTGSNTTCHCTYPQSSVASFFAKDQTYQRTPSQIQ